MPEKEKLITEKQVPVMNQDELEQAYGPNVSKIRNSDGTRKTISKPHGR